MTTNGVRRRRLASRRVSALAGSALVAVTLAACGSEHVAEQVPAEVPNIQAPATVTTTIAATPVIGTTSSTGDTSAGSDTTTDTNTTTPTATTNPTTGGVTTTTPATGTTTTATGTGTGTGGGGSALGGASAPPAGGATGAS